MSSAASGEHQGIGHVWGAFPAAWKEKELPQLGHAAHDRDESKSCQLRTHAGYRASHYLMYLQVSLETQASLNKEEETTSHSLLLFPASAFTVLKLCQELSHSELGSSVMASCMALSPTI